MVTVDGERIRNEIGVEVGETIRQEFAIVGARTIGLASDTLWRSRGNQKM